MYFDVNVQSPEEFEKWVKEVQEKAPKLTEEEYAKKLEPSHLGKETYSNTHLEWVNHADFQAKEYLDPEKYYTHGYLGRIFVDKENDNGNKQNTGQNGGGHHHEH